MSWITETLIKKCAEVNPEYSKLSTHDYMHLPRHYCNYLDNKYGYRFYVCKKCGIKDVWKCDDTSWLIKFAKDYPGKIETCEEVIMQKVLG